MTLKQRTEVFANVEKTVARKIFAPAFDARMEALLKSIGSEFSKPIRWKRSRRNSEADRRTQD